MWSHSSTDTDSGDGQIFSIYADGAIATYNAVVTALVEEEKFRSYFIDLLARVPYTAFRWETPPLTATTTDQPFEFVVLSSPGLDLSADRSPFEDLFVQLEPGGVGSFPNLGGDATLIVPAPVDASSSYGHLGAFLRSAPSAQLHAFWILVGQAVRRRTGVRPLWLNTAGGGVSWLHLRLDDQPKYYVHVPYRNKHP